MDERLVGGVQKLFPDRKVEFTAEWGLTWSTSLLGLLGVGECLGTPGHFLFTGSPDIVIGKRQCVSTSHTTDSEEDSSSSNELIENAHQSNPMKGKYRQAYPEKLGEVFGGLHILLVSKILRSITRQKSVRREFRVTGYLIHKTSGGICCHLGVDLKNGVSALKFSVIRTLNGFLEPNHLCALLHMK